MNKIIWFLFVLIFCSALLPQNVGINADGSNPDGSAMLDVKSTSKGMLIPRMTESEMNAISNPATGLIVFNTTQNNFYFYNGTAWFQFNGDSDSDWIVSGNNMYSTVSGKVGIGVANPNEELEMGGDTRLFIGDGGGSNRTGLLLDGIENGENVILQGFDYGITLGMNILLNPMGGKVSIGEYNPDASAVLHLKSTNMGFLPPRMTKNQRDAIASPATGLIIYQTDSAEGLYNYNGSTWTAIGGGCSVGDFAHGGIVFWVDETGRHGLVAAKEDQSAGARWYAGTNSRTMALGDGPFSGKANTTIIIAHQGYGDGDTYAARICNELQIIEGGRTYDDWYLPSKKELNLMSQNWAVIDASALANGGSAFSTEHYYSSSKESGNQNYWVLYIPTCEWWCPQKWYPTSVRAIRAF